MKHNRLILTVVLSLAPMVAFGACSTTNLTRCLDSVCAINMGANAAARCQYCGSESAGTPPTEGSMKNITVGNYAQYTISTKELKKAPTEPGTRYIWATEQCLKKISGCTNEDVEETYDPLIEQSCTAAGLSIDTASLIKKANKIKNKTSCSSEINNCITNEKHCLAGYKNCESDADFDKHFSECSIATLGCDTYLAEIRSTLMSDRTSMLQSATAVLRGIVTGHQNRRQHELSAKQLGCKDGSEKQKCKNTYCANNMRHKCDKGYEYELQLVEQLCKFFDTACERLK